MSDPPLEILDCRVTTDRAEAAHLLRRIPDPDDHRRQRLALTRLGMTRLDALSTLHREELRRFREEGFAPLRAL